MAPLVSYSSTPLGITSSVRQPVKTKGPLIVIDAGHGGTDEGAKVKRLQEKGLTLLTALYAKKHLEEIGYRVLLTRSKDVFVSLPKRVSMANKTQGAVFISIHFNSASNESAEGVEVFYYKDRDTKRQPQSQKLANYLLHGVIGQTDSPSRGVKAGNYYVIRETEMPAVILEAGFMTNQREWECLRKKSYLEKISKGIAQGVDAYVQSVKNVLGAS